MQKENILIIGRGGREHALGYALHSKHRKLYFAPGNAGTETLGTNIPLQETDTIALAQWAKKHKIALTVVGPESAIAAGIADVFAKDNLPIFAPTKKAAALESSKSWAIEFMQRHSIPHPRSKVVRNTEEAQEYIVNHPTALVIKEDGLAAGKGVIVAKTTEEAQEAAVSMFAKNKHIILQEKLSGPEISLLAFSDGTTVVPLLPAQDHKRLKDGDTGPNTGGMGAYAPVPFVTTKLLKKIQTTILQPTIRGMRQEGIPFAGVLFAGLMITSKGPMVLEYNVRFGDPETQPLLMLLSSDLGRIARLCIEGRLQPKDVKFKKGCAASVVLATPGYPEHPILGKPITGLSLLDKSIQVFHAGTKRQRKKILTAGGRVLAVTTRSSTLQKALTTIYRAIGEKGIHFTGMQYRKDIGHNAL